MSVHLLVLAAVLIWRQGLEGATIDGDVRDIRGRPLPAATVYVRRMDLIEQDQVAPLNARGRFRVTGLPSGDWSVMVGARDFYVAQSPAPFHLSSGQTYRATLNLVPRPMLEGIARFDDGSPVTDRKFTLMITVDPLQPERVFHGQTFETDSTGHFRVPADLPYLATARGGSSGTRVVLHGAFNPDVGYVYPQPMRLTPGRTTRWNMVVLRPARLAGSVSTPNGTPPPLHTFVSVQGGIPFTVGSYQMYVLPGANTDEKGRFLFPSLPPGDYHVVVGRSDIVVRLAPGEHRDGLALETQ